MNARFVCADVNELPKIRRNLANGSEQGTGMDRDRDTPQQLQKGHDYGVFGNLRREILIGISRRDQMAIRSIEVGCRKMKLAHGQDPMNDHSV